MIPENTLAIGQAMRWLALALSSVFLFAVFLVTAGDAIFRRLQRKAIERSLNNKVPWRKLAMVLLSFSLLTSQMAFGQTNTTASSSAVRYQKLFTLVSGIAASTKDACKTEACAKAAEELAAVVADGKEKHAKGLLVDDARKQFHADLNANLLKLRAALIASLPEKEQNETASRCPACKPQVQLKPVQTEECQICDEVLHTALEICALYLPFNQVAALICVSAAALAYGRCIEDFCQTNGHPSN
jgi:hypothetical protein